MTGCGTNPVGGMSRETASVGPSGGSPDPLIANAADGADGAVGIVGGLAHRNDPGSGAAFTAEDNLDPQCPKEGLRPTQVAGKRTRASCPSYAPRYVIASTLGTQPQKVCCAPGSHSPVEHDCPYAGGYGIRFDNAHDRGSSVCRVASSYAAASAGTR